jgi:hypothetical protein
VINCANGYPNKGTKPFQNINEPSTESQDDANASSHSSHWSRRERENEDEDPRRPDIPQGNKIEFLECLESQKLHVFQIDKNDNVLVI